MPNAAKPVMLSTQQTSGPLSRTPNGYNASRYKSPMAPVNAMLTSVGAAPSIRIKSATDLPEWRSSGV